MNTNYCAELIDSLTHKHHVNSTLYCAEINQAIKFRLPDNGRICEVKGKHPANTALPSDPISLNLVPT